MSELMSVSPSRISDGSTTRRRRRPFARRWVLSSLGALLCISGLRAQIPYAAGELRIALEKLTVLGSVLYISAHPDDENTAFLAAMAKGRLYRTGYLSLTRGEGGQNLLGPEQGDVLGIIRTQELLAARRIDGAEQFFTRAIDFGYSKSTEETLEFWGKEQILADVVWVIRTFRPDVIVTRFTPTRGGHGNHTASALLAIEAFAAAADSRRFPEQLRFTRPWKAKRLVWNVFRFSRSPGEASSGSSVTMELGDYSPMLGLSFGELSGMSRSMHKSQGFGALEQRGRWMNAFEHVAGDTAREDLFDGVTSSWSRIPGAQRAEALLRRAQSEFDPARPWSILPVLMQAMEALETLQDDAWVALKIKELKNVILAASGTWLEAVSSDYQVTPGSSAKVTARVLNRSPMDVQVDRIAMTFLERDTLIAQQCETNVPCDVELKAVVPADQRPSQPYWLVQEHAFGSYQLDDPHLIGLAQDSASIHVTFTLRVADRPFKYTIPVRYRWVDPTQGELTRPLVVVPPVSVTMSDRVIFSVKGAPAQVSIVVTPARPAIQGIVRLDLPPGWKSEPAEQPLTWDSSMSDRTVFFRLWPSPQSVDGVVKAVVECEGGTYGQSVSSIVYPHIEPQVFLEPAESRLLALDLETDSSRIGYIAGSGDGVGSLLGRLGYRLEFLSDEVLESGDLQVYDAIVAGVRAYNTRKVLPASHERLMNYVAQGGRYIVQYVTRQQLPASGIGPYPFTISNARVSDETAPIVTVHPDHPLLSRPNRITERDFDGWIQERGLYFSGEWDPRYETILASRDPGEELQYGGLLYTRHGKGYFVYTAYSWFRQLPAGVPGAFRLFVNMLSQDVGQSP